MQNICRDIESENDHLQMHLIIRRKLGGKTQTLIKLNFKSHSERKYSTLSKHEILSE